MMKSSDHSGAATLFLVHSLDHRGILISSSANSLDTAVFKQESEVWVKYELEDTGRAEFPLDKTTDEETFAAGMALDFSSQQEVVISEH